jgi:integrase
MPPRKRRGRGYIEELPSGSFRVVVPAGKDPLTGRRRPIRQTVQTYAEAEVLLSKLQHQVDEDRHPKSAITVGEVIERWLEVAELEETTRDRYEDLIRL